MNFSRCSSIFLKECKHIIRDPFTLILALLLPFLIILILGNAIEFNIKEISTVIVDHDKTTASEKLITTFNSSNYFKTYNLESPKEGLNEIFGERAKAVIFIPPDFDNKIQSGRSTEIQVLIDGADNSSLSSILNYLSIISTSATNKILGLEKTKSPVNFKTRYLFNPELNSKWFAIPGLSAVIIALVSILLTSLTICRERETGSMELLLSTPVKTNEIITGKILPYALLGCAGFIIVYCAARFLFDVPFCGSHWILLLGTTLFIINYLGIGLYISVNTKEQQVAVQFAFLVGMLPTTLLSGFVFPIEYMPDILQYITVIFPARWYIEIVRGEFLKASSFFDLAVPFFALIIQMFFILSAAILSFKRNLE